MEVYLDNAATTKPIKLVLETMTDALEVTYGNPSSLHRMGLEAERKIKEVRKKISKEINAKPTEIIFTSGGTEGNNLAIFGSLTNCTKKQSRIITLPTEHKSVLNAFKELENRGFEVCYGKVDKTGRVDLLHLEQLLNQNTVLVSISYINNETGIVQPIEKIGKMISEKCPTSKFQVDGVQAFGKMDIDLKKCRIHLLTASAHKFHGPKGVGFLYVKEGTLMKPLSFGGSQEFSLRPGTENVPGILGFGASVRDLLKNKREIFDSVLALKKYFVLSLEKEIDDIVFTKETLDQESPFILNISFLGVKSEVLLHSLESKGIYVSSGSACTSKEQSHSHVLKAMGLSNEVIDSAIRFSFSRFTTKEELDYTLTQLKMIVKDIRIIMKR